MSLQIVQNQQLKPIGDKVAIDTQLSTTSENAISNKAVSDGIDNIIDYDEVLYNYVNFSTLNIDLRTLNNGDKLHIIVHDGSNSIYFIKDLTMGIDMRVGLTNNQNIIVGGYYFTSQSNGACTIIVTNTGFLIPSGVYVNGTNRTSNCKITVYKYRNPFYPVANTNTRSIPEQNTEEEPVVEENNEEEQR